MGFLRKLYSVFIDAAQTLLLAASVFVVVYVFLFRPYQVSGASMYPNFEDKEYILTSIISLRFEKPKRGDVIVFKAPDDNEKDFIKRVIGVPGDTIIIKDGDVYVNSQRLNQSAFLKNDVKTSDGKFLKEGKEVTVPPASYFVMGDNRTQSSDSREWGFIKEGDIIGKSFFVYLPIEKIKVIKNPYN